jgi:hypothetical protein
MPSAVADAAIQQFVAKITASAGAVPDALAGLLLKLCARVASLERTTKAQALELDKLRKMPRLPAAMLEAATPKVKTGIDVATGAAVRIEPRRGRGRPQGRKDARPRAPRTKLVGGPALSFRDDFREVSPIIDEGSDEGLG